MAKRSNNFNHEEVKELLSIIDKHKHVLENKKTDRVSAEDKNKTWKAVEIEFNAAFPTVFRTEKILRTKYSNLKKEAKKNCAADKREVYRTGGGSSTIKQTADDSMVLSICHAKQIEGGSSAYDDDLIEEEVFSNFIQESSPVAWPVPSTPVSSPPAHKDKIDADDVADSRGNVSWATLLKAPKNNKLGRQQKNIRAQAIEKKAKEQNARAELQLEILRTQVEIVREQKAQQKVEHELRCELLTLQIAKEQL